MDSTLRVIEFFDQSLGSGASYTPGRKANGGVLSADGRRDSRTRLDGGATATAELLVKVARELHSRGETAEAEKAEANAPRFASSAK
jgi:hypothetical protein